MITIVAGSDPQVRIVRIEGELDVVTVDTCRADLDRVLAATDPPSMLVIDLRPLTILAAVGLHMLGELAVGLNGRGVTTVVAVHPGSLARRLLYMAGLDQRFVVLDVPLQAVPDTPAGAGAGW